MQAHHAKPGRAWAPLFVLAAAGLAVGCAADFKVGTGGSTGGALGGAPMACNDALKTSFKPDTQTQVIDVRLVRQGSAIVPSDSSDPITTAQDLCLVKLLVGPGATAEKDKTARSYTEGIGMEVWLPMHARWNERIRNYGGGGWVGGGHRDPPLIGSKAPAIVIANMGYATGTHDGGHPHSQDGSFAWLSNGQVNQETLRDFTERAQWEQATKTRALVVAFYGRAPKYSYYDGHSQGGRQGMKVAQKWPTLYDGYLIGQPALSVPRHSLAGLYAQVVMKNDLGFSARDKPAAEAFARKVAAANGRAVAACDREQLGFLLDPFACDYDPLKDRAMLCSGEQGAGRVIGAAAPSALCMSAQEATALNKIWYGPTRDGSYDDTQTTDGRAGRRLGPKQLWWGRTRGSNLGGSITSANADMLALAMGDVSYAADAQATSGKAIVNTSTTTRNRFEELSYASYANAFARIDMHAYLEAYMTHDADLRPLRDAGKKLLMWNGLAEDAIPPQGSVEYYERVKSAAGRGTDAGVQQFFRMINLPGVAHSSQGRAYTVAGTPNTVVPLPLLPGHANQTPSPAQDPLFTALVAWVEQGVAPDTQLISSRDGRTTHPACIYPKRPTWDGVGPARAAASFRCQ